ncbi:hypothetical protein MWN34_07380 [Ancylobacter sp. 6x-1]|uniref:EamA domain-containing protein n=1 Tax=Ancylobacter crimeensis TaxID=2579147 RepID=A0ABT0D9Z7_9HYPH|nr:hypothetical protein [Ancylobacter crimeensis]MCK0196734.1 hypothetical protein [Ancylobacter crimeensis]
MTTVLSPERRGHPLLPSFAAWAVLIGSETVAQVALKAGGLHLTDVPAGPGWLLAAIQDPWVIAGIAGYIGSFLAWMVILDRVDLSLGFPLTAIVIVTVTLASTVMFGEALPPLRLAGIGFIVAGAVFMGRGET